VTTFAAGEAEGRTSADGLALADGLAEVLAAAFPPPWQEVKPRTKTAISMHKRIEADQKK